MEFLKLVLMCIISTFIMCTMVHYSDYKFNTVKRCKDCKHYMSEVETRDDNGLYSLCSERYIQVNATDICDRYL